MSSGYVRESWKLDLGYVLNCLQKTEPKRVVILVKDHSSLVDVQVDKVRCFGDFACNASKILLSWSSVEGHSYRLYVNIQLKDGTWVEFNATHVKCHNELHERVSHRIFFDLPALNQKGGIKRMVLDSRLMDRGHILVGFRVTTFDGKYVDFYFRCNRHSA